MQKFTILATISALVTLCASPSEAATLGGTADASTVFTTGGDVTVPMNPTFDPMTPTTGVTVPGADMGVTVPAITVDPAITNALGTLNTISGIVNNPSSAWGLLLGQANAPSAFTTDTLTTAILGSNVFNLDPKTQGIAVTATNLIDGKNNFTPVSATAEFSKLVQAISQNGRNSATTADREARGTINEAVIAGQGKVVKDTMKVDAQQIKQSSSVYSSVVAPESTLVGVTQIGNLQATMGQGINTLLAHSNGAAEQLQTLNEAQIQSARQALDESKDKDLTIRQAMDVYANSTK
ncbi:hypothetical protein [Chamaesiphon minutus]|uniref:Uncharacterized protein n=1 Tax=Chamaesiphon minutus (strain ATCC 27169 / PCC 6605) TaxID=1173020 RepID=K9UET0_CHAP6|nr:hypothetical protein [Chamaesiphon minutus]AFY92931.1 hypothetical protein Cha6605_1810 [Chamaesiphon minutus PCC 6605]